MLRLTGIVYIIKIHINGCLLTLTELQNEILMEIETGNLLLV
jgi:hypothetical protein